MERTLVIIKPDAVQRGLIGPILTRFEQRGLRFAAMKLMQITPELAEHHYGIHKGKDFYPELIEFITSGPVVVAIVEGDQAIEVVRAMMGGTKPATSAPGTIRADYGLDVSRNLVHGSDSLDTAAFEISIFFDEAQILDYTRAIDLWVYREGPGQ